MYGPAESQAAGTAQVSGVEVLRENTVRHALVIPLGARNRKACTVTVWPRRCRPTQAQGPIIKLNGELNGASSGISLFYRLARILQSIRENIRPSHLPISTPSSIQIN